MVEVKARGASLESKVATGGTVKLTVDHAEVHYSVDAINSANWDDWAEILQYLDSRDFELMDEQEAPAERTRTGWRFWACHKYGEEFGFASIGVMLLASAATVTTLAGRLVYLAAA